MCVFTTKIIAFCFNFKHPTQLDDGASSRVYADQRACVSAITMMMNVDVGRLWYKLCA